MRNEKEVKKKKKDRDERKSHKLNEKVFSQY